MKIILRILPITQNYSWYQPIWIDPRFTTAPRGVGRYAALHGKTLIGHPNERGGNGSLGIYSPIEHRSPFSAVELAKSDFQNTLKDWANNFPWDSVEQYKEYDSSYLNPDKLSNLSYMEDHELDTFFFEVDNPHLRIRIFHGYSAFIVQQDHISAEAVRFFSHNYKLHEGVIIDVASNLGVQRSIVTGPVRDTDLIFEDQYYTLRLWGGIHKGLPSLATGIPRRVAVGMARSLRHSLTEFMNSSYSTYPPTTSYQETAGGRRFNYLTKEDFDLVVI